MKAVIRIFTCAVLLFLSNAALAQQPAGAAIQEIHRRSNPSHPGYDGDTAPVQPREVWQNKYGALAADFEAGRSGTSEDEDSIQAARRNALQRCGTRNCKIVGSITNGCLAVVHGNGITGIGGGETARQAVSEAMRKCQSDGRSCEVQYSHCNFPVLIRVR